MITAETQAILNSIKRVSDSHVTIGIFSIHYQFGDRWLVTHTSSGSQLAIFESSAHAAIGCFRAENRLTTEMKGIKALNTTDPIKASKSAVLKRVAKYLLKWARVSKNEELELMVGVFYRDRADCEKLRWAINPDLPKILLDDNALLSPEMIGQCIAESIKIDSDRVQFISVK